MWFSTANRRVRWGRGGEVFGWHFNRCVGGFAEFQRFVLHVLCFDGREGEDGGRDGCAARSFLPDD